MTERWIPAEAVERIAEKWERFSGSLLCLSGVESDRLFICARELRALLASPEATTGEWDCGPCRHQHNGECDLDLDVPEAGCSEFVARSTRGPWRVNRSTYGQCLASRSIPGGAEFCILKPGHAGDHQAEVRAEPSPALAPSIASLLGPHCTEGDEETLAHTTKACREIDR
jgi:hypothetical protein